MSWETPTFNFNDYDFTIGAGAWLVTYTFDYYRLGPIIHRKNINIQHLFEVSAFTRTIESDGFLSSN